MVEQAIKLLTKIRNVRIFFIISNFGKNISCKKYRNVSEVSIFLAETNFRKFLKKS